MGNQEANARRRQVRADRMARYLAIGGPDMTNTDAAAALGVSASSVDKWRRELIAAGTIPRRPDGPPVTRPCGTAAAYRRHLRRGEKPCHACQRAEARKKSDERSTELIPDYRAKRNNLPEVPYQWRSRRYRLAEQALARAEAACGRPGDDEDQGEAIAS